MNPKAIEKAAARLGRMQLASATLAQPDEIIKLIDIWTDFITAFSAFYSILEMGAKTNNKSKNWYGQKKHERRTDPLLKYIKAARNSEEHGLHDILHIKSKNVTLLSGGQVQLVSNGRDGWNVASVAGGPLQFKDPYLALVPAYDDRSKDWCPVPETHLGNPTVGISPYHASLLALAYCEKMLDEASALQP